MSQAADYVRRAGSQCEPALRTRKSMGAGKKLYSRSYCPEPWLVAV